MILFSELVPRKFQNKHRSWHQSFILWSDSWLIKACLQNHQPQKSVIIQIDNSNQGLFEYNSILRWRLKYRTHGTEATNFIKNAHYGANSKLDIRLTKLAQMQNVFEWDYLNTRKCAIPNCPKTWHEISTKVWCTVNEIRRTLLTHILLFRKIRP